MPKKVIFSGNYALDSYKRHKYSKVDFSVSVVKGKIIQNIIVLGQRDRLGYMHPCVTRHKPHSSQPLEIGIGKPTIELPAVFELLVLPS